MKLNRTSTWDEKTGMIVEDYTWITPLWHLEEYETVWGRRTPKFQKEKPEDIWLTDLWMKEMFEATWRRKA